MKKAILIILNILLIVPFILCFRQGGNVAIYMLPVWFIMSVVNSIFSKNKKEIIVYNGCMALFATIGIFICGQLYFKYVYWDSIGEAIVMLEIIIELLYIAVLTGIECLVKNLLGKRKKTS